MRAKDGIALVADKKITRANGNISYEPKIFQDVENILIAAAGPVGLFDKFREEIYPSTQERKDEYINNPRKLIKDAELLVHNLNNEYFDRTRSTLEVLIGLGQLRAPDLQHIVPAGVGQRVRNYQAIGSGEPFGSVFLKTSYSKELNMYQCVALGYFILKTIEEKQLDNAVGLDKDGIPDMWVIPFWPDNYEKLDKKEQEKFDVREIEGDELAHIQKLVSQEYLKYEKFFKNDFVNLFEQVQ